MKDFVKTYWVYLLVLVILFSTLLIAFLWKEDLSLDYKINDQKVANFATTIGAIATSVTLLFLVLQLKEMKKATDAAHRPDFYFKVESCYHTIMTQQEIDRYNSDEYKEAIRESQEYDSIDENDVFSNPNKLLFINKGNGIALNFAYIWSYDKELILKDLIAINPKINWSLKADNYKEGGSLGYCIPEQEMMVFVPMLYFNWLIICQISQDHASTSLFMTYTDKFGKQYSKKFKVSACYEENWGIGTGITFGVTNTGSSS